MARVQRKYDRATALQKIQAYCAYQERSHQEVKEKLYSWGMYRDEVEGLMAELVSTNFLNEQRFAEAFAGGKFRMKSWGRIKIERELKVRNVSAYCIRKGLEEIEEEDYRQTIERLLHKKLAQYKGDKEYIVREKAFRFMLNKGYELALVKEVYNQLQKNP